MNWKLTKGEEKQGFAKSTGTKEKTKVCKNKEKKKTRIGWWKLDENVRN